MSIDNKSRGAEPRSAGKYGAYLIFFAAMLWATDAPFRLHLTQTLSSNFIVLGEHTFDVLCVLPLLLMNFSEIKKLAAKEWLAVAVIAIGGSALASVAFTQAFHYVNPSVAILLQKLQPLLAIGLASTMLKEELSPKFWLWALAALFGAYLISFPGLRPQSYPGEVFNPNLIGVGLALVAAFFWGASTVMGKIVLNKTNFKVMTALRFCVAWVFLLLLNFTQHSFPVFNQVRALDWLFIAIIAVTSGVVSLFIYYRGLQDTKASVATLAELGFPMAAVIVNWIFIPNSALLWPQILGMAILLFAVFRLGGEGADKKLSLETAYEPK
ncbi:MAG: DMT family transporter [Candidatus Doudnabacteria bacterium]|nr:DMT family transporter [Candidatus Doudnabacteria bacterium]